MSEILLLWFDCKKWDSWILRCLVSVTLRMHLLAEKIEYVHNVADLEDGALDEAHKLMKAEYDESKLLHVI